MRSPALAAAVVCWCCEKAPFGNKRARLLAVRDDERQHRLLTRYYQRLGFTQLREVGSDFRSIADRVEWGGEGSLMELDLEAYRAKWSSAVRTLGT